MNIITPVALHFMQLIDLDREGSTNNLLWPSIFVRITVCFYLKLCSKEFAGSKLTDHRPVNFPPTLGWQNCKGECSRVTFDLGGCEGNKSATLAADQTANCHWEEKRKEKKKKEPCVQVADFMKSAVKCCNC